MKTSITNTTKYKIEDSLVKKISQYIISRELGDNPNYYLEIIIVNNEKIKELNSEFRKINAPTDVLTFVYDEPVLGEIYISAEAVEKQCTKYNNDFKKEFIYILIHGLLHICKYDHLGDDTSDELMFVIQKKYFNDILKWL